MFTCIPHVYTRIASSLPYPVVHLKALTWINADVHLMVKRQNINLIVADPGLLGRGARQVGKGARQFGKGVRQVGKGVRQVRWHSRLWEEFKRKA